MLQFVNSLKKGNYMLTNVYIAQIENDYIAAADFQHLVQLGIDKTRLNISDFFKTYQECFYYIDDNSCAEAINIEIKTAILPIH